MHILREREIGPKETITLIQWFAIVMIPVASIPQLLKYVEAPLYSFLPILAVSFGIWIVIAIHNRPRNTRELSSYDRLILVFVSTYLLLGMIILWQMQFFDALLQRASN